MAPSAVADVPTVDALRCRQRVNFEGGVAVTDDLSDASGAPDGSSAGSHADPHAEHCRSCRHHPRRVPGRRQVGRRAEQDRHKGQADKAAATQLRSDQGSQKDGQAHYLAELCCHAFPLLAEKPSPGPKGPGCGRQAG